MNQINPIKQRKDRMRERYKALRLALSPEEKARRDAAICRSATALASFRFADTILLYAPTQGEIDVLPIAEAALAKGKKIAFPICDTDNHIMHYHFVSSIEELQPGAYGIPEPPTDAPVFQYDTGNTLCFVPGLVFDGKGYRLGYGKGFYDRYLSSFQGVSIGVIYSDFILPYVPVGRYDRQVNILLTEKNVRITKA